MTALQARFAAILTEQKERDEALIAEFGQKFVVAPGCNTKFNDFLFAVVKQIAKAHGERAAVVATSVRTAAALYKSPKRMVRELQQFVLR